METKRMPEAVSVEARSLTIIFLDFYALLGTTFFFAYTAFLATRSTVFCSSLCYGAYGVTCSPLKSESSKRAKEMAAPMMEGKAATITIHLNC